ncbi:uncharacterized protein B0T23DRAFT_381841 [Neurospora hispaniola]|uniref:Uncharacterized protein n=1 Tax=Neurospora hispaniola TaxID=588809 RepID=A0AAJ0I563_9PEZI|nr:hypothetical protein B0T23DRAFT_381841 [Neurospora hispaniola]
MGDSSIRRQALFLNLYLVLFTDLYGYAARSETNTSVFAGKTFPFILSCGMRLASLIPSHFDKLPYPMDNFPYPMGDMIPLANLIGDRSIQIID